MRGFLINKNLCLYYWLKKRVGKKWALFVANAFERTILICGREGLPPFNKDGMLTSSRNK